MKTTRNHRNNHLLQLQPACGRQANCNNPNYKCIDYQTPCCNNKMKTVHLLSKTINT